MQLRKLKMLTLSLLALVTVGLCGLQIAAVPAYAATTDLKSDACAGLDTFSNTPSGTQCNPQTAGNGVNSLVNTIVNILSWAVGIAAIIMLIIAGFTFITSAGSSEKVGTAKKTLLYAIAGIVVVVLAQFIVYFTVRVAQNQCPSNPKVAVSSASCTQK